MQRETRGEAPLKRTALYEEPLIRFYARFSECMQKTEILASFKACFFKSKTK